MSAANACTDKQPTAHRQKRRAESGRWLRPPARASVSRLSAPRQSLLSVRFLPRSPSHSATLQAFCRFCQSLPRPAPLAAAVEAPAGRHRTQARPATHAAPWPAFRAYPPRFVRPLRSWQWCRGSAQQSGPTRSGFGYDLRGLFVAARPCHRMRRAPLRCLARQVRRPTKQPTARAQKQAERWFLPSVSAGQSRRRERLPQKRNLALPEPCA